MRRFRLRTVILTDLSTMMLLHAKNEIDAPAGDEAESLIKAIDSARKVIDAIEVSYRSEDLDLGEYE